jgi:hypothetical protein
MNPWLKRDAKTCPIGCPVCRAAQESLDHYEHATEAPHSQGRERLILALDAAAFGGAASVLLTTSGRVLGELCTRHAELTVLTRGDFAQR